MDACVVKTVKRYDVRKKKKHALKNKLTYIFLAFALILACLIAYSHLNQPNQTSHDQTAKAAIVDHLSLMFPNQTFIDMATAILQQAGYEVDYYSGGEVSVEFYRRLPTYGYSVIIFRVHSTAVAFEGKELANSSIVALFTSDVYSGTKYVYEQLTDQLAKASFGPDYPGQPDYFAILPKFVVSGMNGGFHSTVIIMMGCDGLKYNSMAEAFLQKGAKTYIGWNGPVAAQHTDAATISLIQNLLVKNQTVRQAIEETMKEKGPDPNYGSALQALVSTLP
jgi:hypothetical protein